PVADAVQAGIFANRPGAENRIDSFRPATRAEVAAMVGNFMDVQGIAQTSPATPPQQQPTQAPVQQQTPLQGYLVTVPAQTTFTGTLTTGIHSEMARVGDPVYLTIDQPLIGVNGGIVVPMGSQIIGR